MNTYSKRSMDKLDTCHKDLREIFEIVLKYFDNSILTGHRDKVEQNKAYYAKKSDLKWPYSKHNSMPSKAIDVAPYPIDWDDKHRFYYFAGYVKAISEILRESNVISHRLRWGGDWDNDKDLDDQLLYDLVHFELRK